MVVLGKKVLVLLGFLVLIIGCVFQVGNNDIPVVTVEESELISEESPEQEETLYVNEILKEGKIYVYLNDSLFEAEINNEEKTIYVSNKSIETSKEPKNNFQPINLPPNTQLQNSVFTIQNNTLTTLSQPQQQNYTVKPSSGQTAFPTELKTKISVSAGEFYKNYKRSYNAGYLNDAFDTDPRITELRGQDFNDYFKSLNLQDDVVIVYLQFETSPEGDPTKAQIDEMRQVGLIKLYQYVGDHTYPAKVTKNFLVNHSFDYVRWGGIIKNPISKIGFKPHRDYLLSLLKSEVVLEWYDNIIQSEFSKIKELANSQSSIKNTGKNSVLMNINTTQLTSLLSHNFVKNIIPYEKSKSGGGKDLDRSIEVISADHTWDVATVGNATGITVGIIDDGLWLNHTHFENLTIYNATDWADNDNDLTPSRGQDHGTQIASIIAGQSNYGDRFIKSVSHNATLVISRLYDDTDIEAIEPYNSSLWQDILDPDNDGNYTEPSSADILSFSWTKKGLSYEGIYDSYSKEADKTVLGDNGKAVLIVNSPGNEGHISSKSKVNPSGTAKNVLTVGASGDYFN
ncbi:hypothetical protein COV11_04835, partial [Candidatus Woesearchaeota archaeon CG10_big_fil_rev_8_21_14_0_10_30_7]